MKIIIALTLASLVSCKTRSSKSDPKMIGGYNALPNQFPSAIQFQSCSGNKIGERAFLTAAHCVMNKETGDIRDEVFKGETMTIRHGVILESAEVHKLTVEAVAVHHTYVAVSKELAGKNAKDKVYHDGIDIAVIFVKESTSSIKTAVIAKTPPAADDYVVVTGYGCDHLQNDPIQSSNNGTIIVDGDVLQFDPKAPLKYFATRLFDRDYQYGRVKDIRDRFGGLHFKLCPGDSGSAAFEIQQPTEFEYKPKDLEKMVFNSVVGVNSYVDAFASSFTRLDVSAKGDTANCVKEMLKTNRLLTEPNGLIKACITQ